MILAPEEEAGREKGVAGERGDFSSSLAYVVERRGSGEESSFLSGDSFPPPFLQRKLGELSQRSPLCSPSPQGERDSKSLSLPL